eukprot:787141_1
MAAEHSEDASRLLIHNVSQPSSVMYIHQSFNYICTLQSNDIACDDRRDDGDGDGITNSDDSYDNNECKIILNAMKAMTKKISEVSIGSTSTYTDFEPLRGHNISFLLYIWCVASTQETVRVLSGEFHAQTGAFIVSISCGFYPSNRLLPVEYIKYKERHSLAIMMANIGRSTGTLAPSVPQHMKVHLYLLYRVDI